MSLPVVRQLIQAGAASAAALPPGSLQAGRVAFAMMIATLLSERGCSEYGGLCGGDTTGYCADGLDILHAVLAAGAREVVANNGNSLGSRVGTWLRHTNSAQSISAEHGLAVLQALHAGGVDVLAWGPADRVPILHSAVLTNAPALVRWLAARRWRRGT
jgi:hypothetical protein